mgnify:CR=1 FL=1
MKNPIDNNKKVTPEKTPLEKAVDKKETLGLLSFTAQDHIDLLGTPPPELLTEENKGKAIYEILSDEEILQRLKDAEEGLKLATKDSNYRKVFLEILQKGIPFLKEKGRLPAEYEDFDITNL